MEQHGYEGVYESKKREPLFVKGRYCIEGCATFWRTSRFTKVNSSLCDFDHIRKTKYKHVTANVSKDNVSRLSKGNIALLLVLEDRRNPAPNAAVRGPNKGHLLAVANTHIIANTQATDLKMMQSCILLEHLKQYKGLPILCCGDFNSTPDSAVYELWARSNVCTDHPDIKNEDKDGVVEALAPLQHELRLLSGYECVHQQEPDYTNFTESFKGTLDYVWFTPENLSVLAVSKVDDKEPLLEEGALPSSTRPSDHISLVVTCMFPDPNNPKIKEVVKQQTRLVVENHCRRRETQYFGAKELMLSPENQMMNLISKQTSSTGGINGNLMIGNLANSLNMSNSHNHGHLSGDFSGMVGNGHSMNHNMGNDMGEHHFGMGQTTQHNSWSRAGDNILNQQHLWGVNPSHGMNEEGGQPNNGLGGGSIYPMGGGGVNDVGISINGLTTGGSYPDIVPPLLSVPSDPPQNPLLSSIRGNGGIVETSGGLYMGGNGNNQSQFSPPYNVGNGGGQNAGNNVTYNNSLSVSNTQSISFRTGSLVSSKVSEKGEEDGIGNLNEDQILAASSTQQQQLGTMGENGGNNNNTILSDFTTGGNAGSASGNMDLNGLHAMGPGTSTYPDYANGMYGTGSNIWNTSKQMVEGINGVNATTDWWGSHSNSAHSNTNNPGDSTSNIIPPPVPGTTSISQHQLNPSAPPFESSFTSSYNENVGGNNLLSRTHSRGGNGRLDNQSFRPPRGGGIGGGDGVNNNNTNASPSSPSSANIPEFSYYKNFGNTNNETHSNGYGDDNGRHNNNGNNDRRGKSDRDRGSKYNNGQNNDCYPPSDRYGGGFNSSGGGDMGNDSCADPNQIGTVHVSASSRIDYNETKPYKKRGGGGLYGHYIRGGSKVY